MSDTNRAKFNVLPQVWIGDRPRVRGECEPWEADERMEHMATGESARPYGMRPCPFVSCRHHLWTERGKYEMRRRVGVLAAPEDVDPTCMGETCSLDIADGEPMTQQQVAKLFGVSRQAVDVTERRAIRRARSA